MPTTIFAAENIAALPRVSLTDREREAMEWWAIKRLTITECAAQMDVQPETVEYYLIAVGRKLDMPRWEIGWWYRATTNRAVRGERLDRRVAMLTDVQRRVCKWVARGLDNREIAEQLDCDVGTIAAMVSFLARRLKMSTSAFRQWCAVHLPGAE